MLPYCLWSLIKGWKGKSTSLLCNNNLVHPRQRNQISGYPNISDMSTWTTAAWFEPAKKKEHDGGRRLLQEEREQEEQNWLDWTVLEIRDKSSCTDQSRIYSNTSHKPGDASLSSCTSGTIICYCTKPCFGRVNLVPFTWFSTWPNYRLFQGLFQAVCYLITIKALGLGVSTKSASLIQRYQTLLNLTDMFFLSVCSVCFKSFSECPQSYVSAISLRSHSGAYSWGRAWGLDPSDC